MTPIRKATPDDVAAIFTVVNDAAQAYRGVIPEDRWHDPYMPMDELAGEIAAGVVFWVAEEAGRVAGVMGLQDKGAVSLVRHAYVSTARQGTGIGTRLLQHIQARTDRPILIGTWAAATWAIRFYQRHGFAVVSELEKERLLRTFWSVPERQIATSVVLADQAWTRQGRHMDHDR